MTGRFAGALIVGGGPAGASAAIELARAGRPVRLLERSEGEHDLVCGGFLGWDSLRALGRLGVEVADLGARPIRRLRLVSGRRRVEAGLPAAAAGLSRRKLDSALLHAAARAGALVERGRNAKAADIDRLSVRLDDGETVAADTLLLATGKHELRGAQRNRDTSGDPVGLRAALACTDALERALAGMIELHLFDGGYAGLLLQEDGRANLCLSVARTRLREAGGIEPLMAELMREQPLLAERLEEGLPEAWSAVSGVPYGWRTGETRPGLYRLGDQAAVIASLAGDGIAIALASGRAAAEAVIAGISAPDYQKSFAAHAARPIAIGETLRWAAEHRAGRGPMMALAAAPLLPGLAARLTRIGA